MLCPNWGLQSDVVAKMGLQGKTYGEQEALKKKFTTQETDLFDRYNAYQKKQQEEFTERKKKELGLCESDQVKPHSEPRLKPRHDAAPDSAGADVCAGGQVFVCGGGRACLYWFVCGGRRACLLY